MELPQAALETHDRQGEREEAGSPIASLFSFQRCKVIAVLSGIDVLAPASAPVAAFSIG